MHFDFHCLFCRSLEGNAFPWGWLNRKKGKENLIDKWEAKWLRSIKSLSFYDCINKVKWNANFPLVRLKWITLNIQLENRVNSQMGNDSRPWKMCIIPDIVIQIIVPDEILFYFGAMQMKVIGCIPPGYHPESNAQTKGEKLGTVRYK
jgi:hypothetical protein